MEEDGGRREIGAPAFSVIDRQVDAGRRSVSISPEAERGSTEQPPVTALRRLKVSPIRRTLCGTQAQGALYR